MTDSFDTVIYRSLQCVVLVVNEDDEIDMNEDDEHVVLVANKDDEDDI